MQAALPKGAGMSARDHRPMPSEDSAHFDANRRTLSPEDSVPRPLLSRSRGSVFASSEIRIMDEPEMHRLDRLVLR